MDQRLDRLEARFDKLDDRFVTFSDRVGGVEREVAVLAERVSHLPGKGYIVSTALLIIAAVTAVITFGEKLQQLVR